MNTITANQIGGLLRAMGPAMVAWLVARGLLPHEVAGPFVEAVLVIAATVLAMAWSWYSNRAAATAQRTASTPDVAVLVGPTAPDSVKALAADPAETSIVAGRP